jgi:hypothetical protein
MRAQKSQSNYFWGEVEIWLRNPTDTHRKYTKEGYSPETRNSCVTQMAELFRIDSNGNLQRVEKQDFSDEVVDLRLCC